MPAACSGSHDSVNVNGVELSFPGPTSCATCTTVSHGGGTFCSLPVVATPRCTGTRVHLFACSSLEGQGACLDTVANDPYYLDEAGKRWSVVTLSPDDASEFRQVGVVEASLSLTMTDGTVTRVVPVLVHACNLEMLQVLPC